jgi:K+-transporting ATPase A subunit
MGVPPLVLGDQFYRLIHDVVHAGNPVAGVLMILSWFGLVIAVVQIMGRVLLVRNGAKDGRSIHPSEWFFIALYLLCVISLTALRPALVPLLNEHPLLNLW